MMRTVNANASPALQMLKLVEQLRQHDSWTREQLRSNRDEQLRDLRDFTYANSPFYQRFHAGKFGCPLAELPVLTKELVMENFDALVTDRAIRLDEVRAQIESDAPYLGRYRVNATSGTGGRTGLFLFDQAEWLLVVATFARAHAWSRSKVNPAQRLKMASVLSAQPWHISQRVARSIDVGWIPTLRLDVTAPLDSIISQLNDWQPDILSTFPSMARLLVEEQRAGRLHIAPTVIITNAEVVTEETRRMITETWGEGLFDQYATTETGCLAAECNAHCGLHLYDDLFIAEVVDDANQPVPAGSYGARVLVTSLFGRTQPLIRYELDDSIKMATEPCPCGLPFPLISGVQGRLREILRVPAADGGVVNVQPVLFHRVMDALSFGGWQVVQEPDRLRVLIAGAGQDFDPATLKGTLHTELLALGAVPPPIAVEQVGAIPRGATGKAALIKAAEGNGE